MMLVVNKLITKEDPFHIHKLLGIICLLHFVYRYFLFFYYGSMMIISSFDMGLIILHALLSLSSLIFHISGVRNKNSPMIYPEFRLHSIIFALRSVICSFIHFNNLHYYYIIGTCYMTMILADIISYNYKDKNNGKTMNNMPFNKNITLKEQKNITFMHSILQICATIFMLGNIETSFAPLFAIQLAAFLMTLVRKNLITSTSWHIIYALSLWINTFLYYTINIDYMVINLIMFCTYVYVYFPLRLNKYIGWSTLFMLYVIKKNEYNNYISDFILINNYQNYNFGVNYGYINLSLLFRYMTIFNACCINFYYAKALFI